MAPAEKGNGPVNEDSPSQAGSYSLSKELPSHLLGGTCAESSSGRVPPPLPVRNRSLSGMEKLTTFRELWGSNPSRKLGDPHKLGVSKCSSGVFSETTSDLSGLPQVREESRTLNFSESNRPGFYSYTVLRSGCSSCLSAKSFWGRVCNFFPGRLPTSLSSTDAFGREVAPESVSGTPSSGWLSRSGWARTFPGSSRSPFPVYSF